MKNLFLSLLLISLMSCMTEEENLIKNAESYINDSLVQNMNDPESYEPISTKIIDTIKLHNLYKYNKNIIDSNSKYFRKEIIKSKNQIEIDSMKINLELSLFKYGYNDVKQFKHNVDSYKSDIQNYKSYIKYLINSIKNNNLKLDSINKLILSTDTNIIGAIIFNHQYRIKNQYGGLVKQSDSFGYFYQDFIEIYPTPHFITYKYKIKTPYCKKSTKGFSLLESTYFLNKYN